jgi:tRNA (guanine-N7-)-methyltransferase
LNSQWIVLSKRILGVWASEENLLWTQRTSEGALANGNSGLNEGAPPKRAIRSFVLRQGRLTEAQEKALNEQWDVLGLEYLGQPKDFSEVFGRSAPLVLEIGFGNGEVLVHSAQHEPGRDHVGIEVHRPGVGRALRELNALGCGNARIYRHDAVEVLEHEIADALLSEIRVFFPDPWHKKRHQKRRLIQAPLVDLLARKLKLGGVLHLATDWHDYAVQMLEVCEAEAKLCNLAGPKQYSERPSTRLLTHFEKRGARLGHGVWDLLYRRQ